MKPGIEGSGTNEGIRFRVLNSDFRSDVTSFVSDLAKLSVKEGGEEAARRVHRYLTAAATAKVPAHEITVFYGLIVAERVDLGRGAYVAPYEHARAEFDLPDETEPFPKTSFRTAVLVRGLRYGPGVASLDDDRERGPPHVQVAYEFPTEYQIDLERWFYASKLLVDLLSIAARVPLLARTRYVRLATWTGEIDPNFAFVRLNSGGNLSDVWPEGRNLSKDDADAFLALSRGWRTYPANRTPWTSLFVGWRLRSPVLEADSERRTGARMTSEPLWRPSAPSGSEAVRWAMSISIPTHCICARCASTPDVLGLNEALVSSTMLFGEAGLPAAACRTSVCQSPICVPPDRCPAPRRR